MSEELWRDIEGYEGMYKISSHGRVKSLKRNPEKVLRQNENGKGYLIVCLCKYGTRKSMQVHRLVGIAFLDLPENRHIDHIDHNAKNNNRDNLRVCSASENHMNRLATGGTSKFKGVCYEKGRKKWLAYICRDRKIVRLGRFDKEEDAARAYNKAAKELFGEFCHPNTFA